jgi:hypothetical protein
VDDDQIRRLLGGVAASENIATRPDAVALLRSRIESAGGDLDAVERYILRSGGERRHTRAWTRAGLGFNSGCMVDGLVYYVVPRSALPPEWLSEARR